jgi:ferrous iron transport protein A
MTGPILPLDQLKLGTRARIAAIDWDSLGGPEAKRLKQFGFDEGVAIEALHWGPFGKDPLAVRVGRMMVAIRKAQARAVKVSTEAA